MTLIADCANEEIAQNESLIADCIIPKDMETLPASVEAPTSPFEHPDNGKGIVDTACARTVAGSERFEDYKRLLRLSDLETEIRPVAVKETLRNSDSATADACLATWPTRSPSSSRTPP